MSSATVTSKGQITLPKKIREHLRLRPGDTIDFIVEKGGNVMVRAGCTDVTQLKGLLHRPGRRAVSLAEMDAAIVRQHKGRP